MQHLLRTVTRSHARPSLPDAELKLLFTTVKNARSSGQHSDSKLSDPFYDALENILIDLRTVTMDNRDAEAFLKPVSKSEVQDYYDVIMNPMDLQTMLRKVKQKQYKSLREFKDDLDLIWSNCFTYNATEDHPLRQCATRLSRKAEKLLANITDRKDRADPIIPSDFSSGAPIPSRAGMSINGSLKLNGHARSHSGSSQSRGRATKSSSGPVLYNRSSAHLSFPETPALVRIPGAMAEFIRLDSGLDRGDTDVIANLREYIEPEEPSSDDEQASHGFHSETDDQVGQKRKLNGKDHHRPRKRPRTSHSTPSPSSSSSRPADPVQLWWDAARADILLANSVPRIYPAASSSKLPPRSVMENPQASPKKRRQRRKKRAVKAPDASTAATTGADAPPTNSLLSLMNNNIKCMRRLRRTHAKFSELANTNNEDSTGGGGGGVPERAASVPLAGPSTEVEEVLDERSWSATRPKGEMREELAEDCLHWMGKKVLEHAGFQGSSKVAMNVLSGVLSEYLMNVGRTARFLCDQFSDRMSAEEIILHTLFESGTTRISDLERYIQEDVVRYGSRMGELEKKLVTAYREAATDSIDDEDDLFGVEEDEDEEGAFVMGNFADTFGEDFLGLRELGIMEEFGLSSVTVPRRLLKGKRARGRHALSGAAKKPSEPPPPYPPPPPFIPLNSSRLDDQIGLLRPYYLERFEKIARALAPPQPAPTISLPPLLPPPPPAAPAPTLLANSNSNTTQTTLGIPNPNSEMGVTMTLTAPPPQSPLAPPAPPPIDLNANPVDLPDDMPSPAHVKMGPLGQIMRVAAAPATKKKNKGGGGAAAAAGAGAGFKDAGVALAPPKMAAVASSGGLSLPDTDADPTSAVITTVLAGGIIGGGDGTPTIATGGGSAAIVEQGNASVAPSASVTPTLTSATPLLPGNGGGAS